MRLERQPFARLLATVTKATEHKNTIPVLATVRLVGTDGMLAATATNLDVEMTGIIEADTTEPFVGCIDAKLLTAAVNKAGGMEITLSSDGGQAVLTAGRATYKLPILPIDDFPTMDVGKFVAEFEANPAALMGDVAFSMSDEATRYYLNGVYLQPKTATATNGHKLATVALDGLPDFDSIIVPSKTVGLMPKVASKVRLSATKIQFVADGVTLTSRLVDGTFPDYERVIPQNNDRLVRVDSAALKAAVERIAIVSKEAAPGARLVISNDEIALSVQATVKLRTLCRVVMSHPLPIAKGRTWTKARSPSVLQRTTWPKCCLHCRPVK